LAASLPLTETRWRIARLHRTGTLALLLSIASLISLYAPVFAEYGSQYFWDEDDNHASVLLVMTAYAFYSDRGSFEFRSTRFEAGLGAVCVLVSLIAYLIGRIADIVQLQGGSIAILAMGLTYGFGGARQLQRWWLPCALLVFIVPWVGSAFDTMLVPMRLFVTKLAVDFVALLGYPVTASGVIINVGFVRMTVAGACVGLRSMVSMMAIAALFLHFFPPKSWREGLTFFAGAAAIALMSNFVRVLFLVLVAAISGAGALAAFHDFAAYLEVIVALGAFLLLARLLKLGEREPA
jgi:exosortase